MKDLDKKLCKFSSKEKGIIENLIKKIIDRDFIGLDCKKLKGLNNLFRIRKGRIRIIFKLKYGQEPTILTIERRREDTYNL